MLQYTPVMLGAAYTRVATIHMLIYYSLSHYLISVVLLLVTGISWFSQVSLARQFPCF